MKKYLLFSLGCVYFLTGCGASQSVPPPVSGDFSIAVSPSSAATMVGSMSTPVTVSLTALNGFSGAATVTVSGFPMGINAVPAATFMLSPGMQQQITFSAPAAAGTFTVEFQGVSGALAHSASATLSVTPQPNPYLVSASYYPWYVPAAWVHQGCYNGMLRDQLVPPQLPALGTYNSGDESVVTQQIAWSTAAGINVWDLEWVGPDNLLDPTLLNSVLTNPHIGDLRVAIFYDYAIRFNNDFNLTPDKVATIVSDFQYIAAHYFTNASYLRVGQNRPVVYFYAALVLSPVSSIQPMVSALRSAMSNAGYDVYLIGDEYYPGFAADPARIASWDAIFGYNAYAGQGGYSDENGYFALQSSKYIEYQAAAQAAGVDFVPSLTPGYNDRAIRLTCADNPALARRTSAAAPEGSMFMSFLENLALPYASSTRYKMIHITSFNEWHEDSQIEPSLVTATTTMDNTSTGKLYTQGLVYEGYGTTYLDILRSAIAAAKP